MKKCINSTLALVLSFTGAAAMADSAPTKYDANNDGIFDENEFYSYMGDAGLYSNWDTDSDGFIDENEFNEIGFNEDYDSWDLDNDSFVDASEFYDGSYKTFDANENGHWDGNEWDDANEAGWLDV